MLSIELFGDVVLRHNGSVLAFKAPPRTLPLLAYIVLHRKEVIARERIAAQLWPDDPENAALGNLRRHLHYLKNVLPANAGEYILIDRRTLQWNLDLPMWLDVEAFEAASADESRIQEAIELYRDDLLPLCEDDWIYFERERLRNVQTLNLERALALATARGDRRALLQHAQRLLALDPWREDVMRQLITLRRSLGDRAGALAEYERFAKRLQDELGTDPMPETLAALTEEPVALPQPATESVRRAPFVGRESELERLRAWWSRAARTGASIMLIGGEAGIGKTSLTEALAALVQTQGVPVYRGTTSFSESMPYEPFIVALRDAGNTDFTVTASPSRVELFEHFVNRFRALAVDTPALLVIEDLHWADEDTLALLQHLILALSGTPLHFVATYRDEETPRAHPLRAVRRRLSYERRLSHLALGPLHPRAVAELARLSDADIGERDIEEVHRLSAGNPLFVNELLYARRNGQIAGIPQSVHEIVATRLSALDSTVRNVAQTAAVCGTAFDVEVLSEATGLPEDAVTQAIEALTEYRFIRPESAGNADDYAFRHDLIRSAIYETLPETARTRLHYRIAAMLEQLHASHLHLFAHTLIRHFESCGMPGRALPYYIAAAHEASRGYASKAALDYAERGLRYATDDTTRANLLLARENIHRRRADRDLYKQDLDLLNDLMPFVKEEPLRCEILVRNLFFAFWWGERGEDARMTEELLAKIDGTESAQWRATVLLADGALALRRGDIDRVQRSIEEALPVFENLRHAAAQVICNVLLAEAALLRGAPVGHFVESARLVSGTQFSPQTEAMYLEFRAADIHGDLGAMQRIAKRLLDHATADVEDWNEGLGRPYFDRLPALPRRVLFMTALYENDLDAAAQHLGEAERQARQFGNEDELLTIELYGGWLQMRRGALREALRIFLDVAAKARAAMRAREWLDAMVCAIDANYAVGERAAGAALASELLVFIEDRGLTAYRERAQRGLTGDSLPQRPLHQALAGPPQPRA